MNRKEFLELVGRSAVFAAAVAHYELVAAAAAPSDKRRVFTPRQRLSLKALADEIVPASDGMPAAGELGAVAYLEPLSQHHEAVASALRDALASLERMARERHRARFDRLPSPARVAILEALEKDDADRFRAMRDLVYEAYYTHPVVWRRLGYEFIEGEAAGRTLEPFEEALLARVRQLPRLYRDVT